MQPTDGRTHDIRRHKSAVICFRNVGRIDIS
jgi:hypothetical protein